MTFYTHHYRLDLTNHCVVNDRPNYRGRGTALCGTDLTNAMSRPPTHTVTTCADCLDAHTELADEPKGATT